MEANVFSKYLKLALDQMNSEQLDHFRIDLEGRMDFLKTYLMEHSECEESMKMTREEYNILKTIRTYFVVDLNKIG